MKNTNTRTLAGGASAMVRRLTGLLLWLALAAFGIMAAAQPARPAPHAPHAPHQKAGLAISAAFAPDGNLWVVGVNAASKLTLQVSTDDGRSWSPVRLLDSGSDRPAADGEARPKLAFGPHGVVIIAYTNPLAKPYTGAIRMLRSADAGNTFSRPFTVHRDRQIITHRFESIAFDAAGRLHVVWVDKRDQEIRKQQGNKHAYRGAAIYRNVSSDGGLTFGDDRKLADYSCECCRIALAPAPGGNLAALWRHVFAPNIRDHAFALLTDAAPPADPVRSTFDNWAIDACPHHGPGLAAAASGGYHAVWFGDRAGDTEVRYGRLDAGGAPASPPVALPDGRAEHADVISAGNQVAIAWRSFDGSANRLKAWVSGDSGAHFKLRELAQSAGPVDNPLLLRKGERIFVVWNTKGKTYVTPL